MALLLVALRGEQQRETGSGQEVPIALPGAFYQRLPALGNFSQIVRFLGVRRGLWLDRPSTQ